MPQLLPNVKNLWAHFSESLKPYKDDMSIKKNFTAWILNYQLSDTANSAFMGFIDHVA